MSNNEWDDLETGEETPRMKDLRKQIDQLSKSLKDAEAGRAAAESKLTVASLSDALKAKGVNPKAARFIVSDGVDASDETALTNWLEENKELFPSSMTEATAQQEAQQPQQPAVDGDVVSNYQQLTGLPALQRPADMNKLVEAERTLPDNATPEQVAKRFRAQGL